MPLTGEAKWDEPLIDELSHDDAGKGLETA